MCMENIVLIGYMGVGKGTIARALSQSLEVVCVDTDDIIESMTNNSIKKIFKNEGEKKFRKLEQNVADWLIKSVKSTIISTGGGFYKVQNLQQIGTIVYLSSSYEAILERILSHPNAKKKIAKRPLLINKKEAKKLFEQRVGEYKRLSDITIDVTNKTTQEIVDEIKRSL